MLLLLDINIDELECILTHLEIKDILVICKVCRWFYEYYISETFVKLLSNILGMHGASLNQLLLKYHSQQLRIILNYVFHGGTITPLTLIDHYVNSRASHREFIDLALIKGFKVCGNYYFENKEEQITDSATLEKYDHIRIYWSQSYLDDQLKASIGFKTITIDYDQCDEKMLRLEMLLFNDQTRTIEPLLLNNKSNITQHNTINRLLILKPELYPLTIQDVLDALNIVRSRYYSPNRCIFKMINNDDYDTLMIELCFIK